MDVHTPNIWQLQSRRDLDGLVEALRHADPEVRRHAAAALRTLDAAQTVDALKEALRVEADWDVQTCLTAAIQHLTHESTLHILVEQGNVSALVGLLHSPETDDVLAAIEGLVELGDRLAVEPLVVLFHDESLPDEVRYAAAEALIRLQGAPAVVTLLAALRRENPQVRANAARVLGEIRARWATRGLIEQIDDPDPEARAAVENALQRIGTPAALRALEHPHDDSVLITLELPVAPLPDESDSALELDADEIEAGDEFETLAGAEAPLEAGVLPEPEALPEAEARPETPALPQEAALSETHSEPAGEPISPYRAAVNGLIEMLEAGRRSAPPAEPAPGPAASEAQSDPDESDDDPDGLSYPVDVAF